MALNGLAKHSGANSGGALSGSGGDGVMAVVFDSKDPEEELEISGGGTIRRIAASVQPRCEHDNTTPITMAWRDDN